MALPSFCRDTVVRLRPRSKMVRGTSVPDWHDPDKLEIAGCSIQELTTGSDRANRRDNSVSVGARLYAPSDADIRDGDRIVADGQTWLVEGHPLPKRSPTGRVSHLAVALGAWRG